MSMKSKWLFLIGFMFIVSIRFFYLHLANSGNNYSLAAIHSNGDATHYYEIAQNIFKHNVYSDNNSEIPTQSATWRPPVWPFVLSMLFYISDNPWIIILCKSVLETVLILLGLYVLKKKLNIKGVYLLPFLLIFIEPQFVKYSVTFLSESLSAVMILLVSIMFITLSGNKSYSLVIPVLSAIIVLCHPVSVFFIVILFGFYLISNIKTHFKVALFHGLLFSLIVLSWPYRNFKTFNEGLYLTASQGATFSKGWNEKVTSEFTNVDGDLADETMNFKYLDKDLLVANTTVLQSSKLCKMGALRFIETLSFSEKVQLVFKKIRSNFIPYPEKPKHILIENAAIFFRILYLFVFLQMIYRFLRLKINMQSQKDRVFIVIFSIFIGQIVMSSYVYTGLRFNSIYGLALLFAFLYLNSHFILDKIVSKWNNYTKKI